MDFATVAIEIAGAVGITVAVLAFGYVIKKVTEWFTKE